MVLPPQMDNVSEKNKAVLSGIVTDRINANLQEYTDFLLIDGTNEKRIIELQKKSARNSMDQDTSIEIGKMLNAEYGLFPAIRYAGGKYSLTLRLTNLSTSQSVATVTAAKSEESQLYNQPGCAVDLLTIKLCEQIGIQLSATERYILEYGEDDLTLEQQLENERGNLENFKKLLSSYDRQLSVLSKKTDVENQIEQKRIEALRALNESKMKFAQERLKRLIEENNALNSDKQKDIQRKKELLDKRNELSSEIASKIAQIRNEEINNLSLIQRLNNIESKKKILIDICNNLEIQKQSIRQTYDEMFREKEQQILDRPYRTGELSEGKPTEIAFRKRNAEVEAEKKQVYEKCNEELLGVTQSVFKSKQDLAYDIYKNYNDLKRNDRIISSLTSNKELNYQIGTFDANKQGWNFYAYFYSDGILLGQKEGHIYLKNLTGRNYNLSDEDDYEAFLDDADLYSSLLMRGERIVTFELNYNVEPDMNQKSKYVLNLKELKLKETINDIVLQIYPVNKSHVVECLPGYDITSRIEDVLPFVQERLASENYYSDEEKRMLEFNKKVQSMKNGSIALKSADVMESLVDIHGKGIKVLATEVTQGLYQEVMGENPSTFKGVTLPVESVSWINAIVFCNKLSLALNIAPYYIVGGETDPSKWKIPTDEKSVSKWADKIKFSKNSSGFRLPKVEEWELYAKGGKSHSYSGGSNINDVCWYKKNSEGKTHEVGSKIPNDYGLFDLSGNVAEWCWDAYSSQDRWTKGGSWNDSESYCTVSSGNSCNLNAGYRTLGFRIVCSN